MAVELAAAYISLLPDTSKIAPGVKLALARTDGDIVILPDLTRFSTTLKTGTERAAVTAGKSSGSKFSQAFQALTKNVTDLDADSSSATSAGRTTGSRFAAAFSLATPDLGDVDADPAQAAAAGRTAGKAYALSFTKASATGGAAGGLAGAAAASVAKAGVAGLAVASAGSYCSERETRASFSRTMNQIAVVAQVPTAQMAELNDLALKLGRDTAFLAADAASAMLELAKNGISPATIQTGALSSALTLAAAGGVEMSDAAKIMGNSINALGLQGKDAASVAAAGWRRQCIVG